MSEWSGDRHHPIPLQEEWTTRQFSANERARKVTTDQSQAWKITLLLTLFKGGDWYPGNYKMDRVVAYDDNGWIEEWYQIRNKEWWKIITL